MILSRYFFVFISAIVIANSSFAQTPTLAITPISLELDMPSGEIMSISQFKSANAETHDRVLWLPSEYGVREEGHYALFSALAKLGYDVWLADLQESYFIPQGRSSLSKVPLEDVSELIAQSLPKQKTRRLFIGSSGRGAVLSVLALKPWLEKNADSAQLGGLVFIHPNFQAASPASGSAMEYLPIVDNMQMPIYILQPEKSGKVWYLKELVQRLNKAGSKVYSQILPDVGDGYQSRPQLSALEKEKVKALPAQLHQALRLLGQTEMKMALKAKNKTVSSEDLKAASPGDSLQSYSGRPQAPALVLNDITGKQYRLADYRGKVVVLNFWATWCPPCIEEVPSLGRLQKAFSQEDLVVLSVDIGESKDEVTAFLKEIPADYPVMLDPEGSTVKAWKIHAYPTTFVIDRQAKIKLAFYGGLEWDDERVVKQLREIVASQ